MNITSCDVCGVRATKTVELYVHNAGYRGLFQLHQLRMEGRMVDLCDEHVRPLMEMTLKPKAAPQTVARR
jgi:hypothetical protein